jgi:hypothetical protein
MRNLSSYEAKDARLKHMRIVVSQIEIQADIFLSYIKYSSNQIFE